MFALTWNPFWHFLVSSHTSYRMIIYVHVRKQRWQVFEVQNLVSLFNGNYFELHNIDFFKLANVIVYSHIFPPMHSDIRICLGHKNNGCLTLWFYYRVKKKNDCACPTINRQSHQTKWRRVVWRQTKWHRESCRQKRQTNWRWAGYFYTTSVELEQDINDFDPPKIYMRITADNLHVSVSWRIAIRKVSVKTHGTYYMCP